MYNNQFIPNQYMQQRQPMYQTQLPIQQYEQPMQQQTPQVVQTGLQGKRVESVDVVKTIEIPLDGSISYFPLTDGKTIVTKQLTTNGTSKITIYKEIEQEQEQPKEKYLTENDFKALIKDISFDDIEDIREDIKDLKKQIKGLK